MLNQRYDRSSKRMSVCPMYSSVTPIGWLTSPNFYYLDQTNPMNIAKRAMYHFGFRTGISDASIGLVNRCCSLAAQYQSAIDCTDPQGITPPAPAIWASGHQT